MTQKIYTWLTVATILCATVLGMTIEAALENIERKSGNKTTVYAGEPVTWSISGDRIGGGHNWNFTGESVHEPVPHMIFSGVKAVAPYANDELSFDVGPGWVITIERLDNVRYPAKTRYRLERIQEPPEAEDSL